MAHDPMTGGVHPLKAMAGALNRLCEDLMTDSRPPSSHEGHVWQPPTDVFECDNVFIVRMAVSGLTKDAEGQLQDVEVLVEDDAIVIRGRRNDQCPHTKRIFHQMAIYYGRFGFRVRIRAPFDRDGVHAEYRDGFLEVIVPKADRDRPAMHHIEVRS